MNAREKGISGMVMLIIIFVMIILSLGIFYYAHHAFAPALPSGNSVTPPTETTEGAPTTSTSAEPPTTSTAPMQTNSLTPTRGPVGTVVTIHGKNFGKNNTIEMNGLASAAMRGIPSTDGKTLHFTIPTTLAPICKSEMCAQFLLNVTPNSYSIIIDSEVSTETIDMFTVTPN